MACNTYLMSTTSFLYSFRLCGSCFTFFLVIFGTYVNHRGGDPLSRF